MKYLLNKKVNKVREDVQGYSCFLCVISCSNDCSTNCMYSCQGMCAYDCTMTCYGNTLIDIHI